MAKIKITAIVEYDPKPGWDGYAEATSVAECFEIDKSLFDESPDESLWAITENSDDTTWTMELVED